MKNIDLELKLRGLIGENRSHPSNFYVASVLRSVITYIEKLEAEIDANKKSRISEPMPVIDWTERN
jgi:hypothetical protein